MNGYFCSSGCVVLAEEKSVDSVDSLVSISAGSLSASLTADLKPLTALPKSEPSVLSRLVPNMANTIARTISN